MDGWQWTAAALPLNMSWLRNKKKDSSNVNSSTSFMQWLLFIIFISQQVNALPIVLWDVCLKVALLNIQVGLLCWVSSSWHFKGWQCPPHLELLIQRHQVTSQNTRMLTQDSLE
jgi:hypothetical protein